MKYLQSDLHTREDETETGREKGCHDVTSPRSLKRKKGRQKEEGARGSPQPSWDKFIAGSGST